MTVGVMFWAMPGILAAMLIFQKIEVLMFTMASSFGVALFLSQYIGKRYEEFLKVEDMDTSLREMVSVSFAYYSLVIGFGTMLGYVLFILGFPQIGFIAAFGSVIIELYGVVHFETSPLTQTIAQVYSVGAESGWWGKGKESADSSSVLRISINWIYRSLKGGPASFVGGSVRS